MSKEFFDAQDWPERVMFAVSNGTAASFAYERLAVHRSAARIQMTRIWSAASAIRPLDPETFLAQTAHQKMAALREHRDRMVPLTYELHFYFVAIYDCCSMLKALTGQPELLAAKKIYDAHRNDFEEYATARHSFEHFRERLPGGHRHKEVEEIQPDKRAGPHRVFFGLEDGHYKHSDKAWDVRPARFEELDAIMETVVSKVREVVSQRLDSLNDGASRPAS